MLEMLLITKGQGHKIPGKPLMKIPRKATFSTTLAFYYCSPINSTAEMKLNSERRRQNFEFLCIFSFWPFKFNPEQILVFKAKSNWSSLMPKWAFDVNCQGHVLTFRKDELCWDLLSDWIENWMKESLSQIRALIMTKSDCHSVWKALKMSHFTKYFYYYLILKI